MTRSIWLEILPLTLAAGCAASAASNPSPPPGDPATAPSSVAPPPVLDARRDECVSDADCGFFSTENERIARSGGQEGCCIGGGAPWSFSSARKDWISGLDAVCAARPPGPCPGGNGPPIRAACQAGHCSVTNP